MSCVEKIDARSEPAINSAVRLFHVPPTNVSNEEAFFREVLPLNAIPRDNANAPILFRLFNDRLYSDMSRVYLYVKGCIHKQNASGEYEPLPDTTAPSSSASSSSSSASSTPGARPAAAATPPPPLIGTIQYGGQTIVQQLRVHIGTTEVYDSGPLYAYKALMTAELSQSKRMKKTFLATGGYHPSLKHDDASDEGFKKRCAMFSDGKNVQLYSRLEFDLGNQENYMLNNVDILFTIYRNRDDFFLHNLTPNDTGSRYRFFIEDIRLYVKMHAIQPSLDLAIYNQLKTETAKYALRRVEVRNHFLTEGRTEFIHNVFTSQIPRRITIGMVANAAYNGDITKTPFNFQHFNLRDISVQANGKTYPYVGYDLDFPHKQAIRAYVDLWEALGAAGGGTEFGPDLTIDQWYNGWTFFTIPMTSTLDDTCGFELVRTGTTTLRLRFDKEKPIPPGGVEVIVLGEFDQLLMIDESRKVVSDNQIS